MTTVNPPGQATSSDFRVDDAGVHVQRPVEYAISVFFGSQRVWSLIPSRDGKRRKGWTLARWPDTLRPYLSGLAEVSIRRLETDEELFRQRIAFGGGTEPISVLDPAGAPLAVAKNDHLSKMFGAHDLSTRQALVATTQEAIDVLCDRGVVAFLAFGCLLGAVREGRLIGHDDDADIVYVARSTHPFDVIRESLELERHFVSLGWSTRRMSGADFKLSATMPDGHLIGIDVFTAFYQGDVLYVMPSIRSPIEMSSLAPQSTVELEGHTVTAPADPEVLLEATYGPGWRTPDPSFKYTPHPDVRRFMSGVMRGERRHHGHWQKFYQLRPDAVPTDPSPFARWLAEQEADRGELVDIGSGTGRDSLWLASEGFRTLGFDYATAGVDYARARAQEHGISAEFAALNLYDLRDILVKGALLAHERRTSIVFARFLVHALDDAGRANLWLFSRSLLLGMRGRLYLEFRTEATVHTFGEHYRQFVQPDVVVAELRQRGFSIEHLENSYGLAAYKDEDPRVCRIVARLKG